MWDGPGQDPGGGSTPPPTSSHELSDLKDQFEQQQVLIAQLKEMIRKSEQSKVTQEKVDEYMNTLSRRSGKAKKSTKTDEEQAKKTVDLPASQKISLLRQQVEENKLRLAERGKSQKGIEEMVTQLKAQLDDSQQLISQNPLNISLSDNKLDYSENSSSQELYTILLAKEKRISDLLGKVQKLESNVLDLQENVKEKDSVIDARTKAITLMTENLSRKGKTTLDALDDTKEQMRKMQENFVALEADMKARQVKLLEDLKLKNYEIAELQESNSRLASEKEALLDENTRLKQQLENSDEIQVLKEKIKELEESKSEPASRNSPQRSKKKGKKGGNNKTVQDETDSSKTEILSAKLAESEATIKKLTDDIEQWKIKENEFESKIKELQQELVDLNSKQIDVKENDDLTKLKKQLDESNKNMIKVKAQHKSKVKELQKKIDAFKKISDTNSEIVRLESENCKLNQKLAELEEEKGSLQLKLVESDSVKVSEPTEREKELEEQIQDHQRNVEEKDKIISILEADITNAKNEIENLSEKLNSLSHLENAQVSSEMASIQFEEQMDSLENEKKQLMIVNENFEKEREQLLEKINDLKKEKQEIATKLEHYIQENIELIDKMEKLSAEKVSSAESIEIVEGLTQQEKLELEAYQKNLDLVAGNLKASEENLPQVDLNESVNELTEETSELLQKIELFTVERREVMDKMEELKQENNSLNIKIKEIENNRDVLVETYEQLQTEKEGIDKRLEDVLKENEDLKQQQSNPQEINNSDLTQKYVDEINELKSEIDGYKIKLDEKETDLDSLAHMVKELQDKLEDEQREKSQLSNNLIDINRTLSEMEADYVKLQQRIQELEDHNNSLSQLLEKSQEELESANNAEWEHQRQIESKDNEIAKLQKDRENTECLIADLQQTIQEKDLHIQNVTADLKEKYTTLQKQLEQNSGDLDGIKQPLEAKIDELTHKNKEQLDKMKKIAANLKKKTQAYQELEEKVKENEEKWEKEIAEKDLRISQDSEKINSLLQQLQELETEINNLQQMFRDKSRDYEQLSEEYNQFRSEKLEELRSFEEKNVELQSIITDLRIKAEKANEINLQQELMQNQEPVQDISSNDSCLQAKIQELEMIVETQDSEIVKYKERIAKLEEGISFVEERRLSLERKANELGAELEEKLETVDEISQSEDRLEKRLKALTAHDEAIEKKLQDSLAENQDLSQRNQKITEKNEKLKRKLAQTLEKLKEIDGQQNIVAELENTNEELKKQLHDSENELKNLQADRVRMLEESKNDLERLNNDWQSQFDNLLCEKNELSVECEKLVEKIKEISEGSEDLNELKGKLDTCQVENRNYEEQIQKLFTENQNIKQQLGEIDDLKQTIAEQKAQIEANKPQNALSSFFDNVVTENYQEKYEQVVNEKLELEKELEMIRLQLDEARKEVQPAPNNLSSFFDNPTVNIDFDNVALGGTTSENYQEKYEQVVNEKLQLEQELETIRQELVQARKEVQQAPSNLSSFFDNPPVSNTQIDVSFVNPTQNYQEKYEQVVNEKIELQKELEMVRLQLDEAKKEVQPAPSNLSSFFDNPKVNIDFENVALGVTSIENYQEKYEQVVNEKLHLEQELQNVRQELDEAKKQPSNQISSFFDNPPVNEAETLKQEIEKLELEKSQLSDELKKTLEIMQNERLRLEEGLENQQNVEQNVNPIPFTWSEPSNDPFAFVQEPQIVQKHQQPITTASPQSGNTEEELLNKIKTLEFMLYNMEKEKDEALLQCHQLSNELTRLVYKTENLSQNQIANLELQIVGPDTTDSQKELQQLEFEKTRPTALTSLEGGPVSEEFIQPKSAYVCQGDVELSPIESQIVTDFTETPQSRQQLHDLEFEPVQQPIHSTDQPVQEPQMSAQEAYLCFGENDDGWGCSQDDVTVDEEYAKGLDASPIDEMRRKIQTLESERSGFIEEIKQLQLKTAKLVKKLKELKQKNEQLTSQTKNDDFFNLDDAIQEELKLQIQQIEKKLKETQTELDKEKNEKASILKRIDVLTSANERMVEIKEKQDVELMGWQQNCRELQAKLEQFEWGDDGFIQENKRDVEKSPSKVDTSELSKKIEELNETIKDLTLDNEELQTLLEEQRTLRLNAEKMKIPEQIPENMKTESEYLQVVSEKEELQQQIQLNLEEKKELQNEVNNLIKTNSEILAKLTSIETESEELKSLLANKDHIIADLNNSTLVLEQEKAQVLDLIKNLESEKSKLLESTSTLNENQERIHDLSKEKEVLFQELQTRNIQIETMQETLNKEMATLKSQLDLEMEKAQTLIDENDRLHQTISQKDEEISRFTHELSVKNTEITDIIQQLNQEWELRVDQRGSDVAESWKLHVDARETEFSQLEQALRKEINELEEKCNALVNENNELRKNVDAEIRNEVDRVSALQQQINDRQTLINELTQQLQDKQIELENLQRENKEDQGIIYELLNIVQIQDKNKLANEITNRIQIIYDKEQEINGLRHQLDEITANFAKVQDEYNKNNEELAAASGKAEEYRIQLEMLKDNHVTLQQTVADHNHTIANLTETLQQVQNLKHYENENAQNLQHNVAEFQRLNNELNQQIIEKTNQLDQNLKQLEEYQRIITEKEGEINRYRGLVEEKEREYTYALENLNQENKIALNEEIQKVDAMKRRILENEDHYEGLLAGKDSEIESLTYQLNEEKAMQKQAGDYAAELDAKNEEIVSLQQRITEQDVLLEEEAKQIAELRAIIEEQVIKIEDLKKELFQKSNDFDSIIAEMDISRLNQTTEQSQAAAAAKTEEDDDDLSAPVRRAELDLALYMLHQRDVRCEELTVELTQLLEERDTLQLRLSNALREKEEIARKIQLDPGSISIENPILDESSGAIAKSRDTEVSDGSQSNPDPLATKLSELRTMGYRRDKTFVDEQELRRLQELSIMQQHRDVASKLPAEAAARLVDASYTLSRDVQSPSKVLLNWLWGRSTPKVNNI